MSYNACICIYPMEDFGDVRCIFCGHILPLTEYPWVGSVMQCGDCRGFQQVKGHYLEYDGNVTFAVSKVPRWILNRLNQILAANR
jgi:hypothetical protein